MSQDTWYYAVEGKQYGPTSFVELRDMAQSIGLKPGDLVWSEGMASWQSASSVPGLLPPQGQPVPAAGSQPAPGKSRRLFPRLAAAVAVLAVMGFVAGAMLWTKIRSPDLDELLAIVPREATAMVAVRGLPHLVFELGLLQSVGDDPAFSQLADVADSLGIDLNDRKTLLATGLDLLEPIGISLNKFDGHNFIFYYLPATDIHRLSETFRRFAEAQSWALEGDPLTEGSVVQVGRGNLTYAAHREHLIFAYSLESMPSAPYLKRLVEGELGSVINAAWFPSMKPLVKERWHVLGLLDPTTAAPLKEGFARFSRLAGMGVNLTVDSDAIRVRYYEASPEGVPHDLRFPGRPNEDRLAARIAGRALGAVRISSDLESFFAWRQSAPAVVAEALNELLPATGVDLQRDLAPHLDAPFSLAMIEDESAGDMATGTVFWSPLKPGHEIETLRDLPQQEFGGETWYRTGQSQGASWLQVVDGHLLWVFASSPESVLSANPRESLLASIERKDVRASFLAGHDMAIYLDVPEIVSAFREGFEKEIPEDGRAFLDRLGELAIRIDADEQTLSSEWVLHPSQRDGFAKLVAGQGGEKLAHSGAQGERKQAANPSILDGTRQRQTVAKIRNLGNAYMSWFTDQVGAASAGARAFHLGQYKRKLSAEEVSRDLHPSDTFFYMDDVDLTDGWGHPIEVWRTDDLLQSQTFLIRSPGRDGVFEGDDYEVGPFPATDYDRDVVWIDGYFGRWPEGVTRR